MKRLVPAMMIPLLSISLPLWQPTGPLNCASCALAQEAPRQGSVELTPSVLKENGCPVDIVSAKALLDFNSFGTPESSRVYLTYKNVSAKNVFSVNFRVRFTDSQGSDLGTFQGSRTCTVLPDGEGSEKWKKEGVLNPNISSYKVRVLQVKFEDGSQWDSQAMATAGRTQGQQQPQQQPQQQDQYQEPSQDVPAHNTESLPPVVAPQEMPQQPSQQPILPPIPFNSPSETPVQLPAELPVTAPNSTPDMGPVANPADDSQSSGDAFTR
ncbi:MAG: hypothetical protein SFY67_11215 [Candidatus Melainabacteria bacterium]|nr:hypothetical protein [Candidatus Melainabacteria bacterium]